MKGGNQNPAMHVAPMARPASAPAGAGKGGASSGALGSSVGQMWSGPAMATQEPVMPSQPPQVAPQATAAPQSPNAFQTGLDAQNSAMDFFRNQMNGGGGSFGLLGGGGMGGGGPATQDVRAPGQDLYNYNPTMAQAQSYNAAKLSDADINQYINPYTQNVIDASMADLDKARMNALNNTGAAASRGGAFGGDRHGIMEAQNNADYLSQVASTSAQLRNQGFQNAQNAAMGDINAMNQQRASNAGMAQQAAMANAGAQNARDQFVGSLASQNDMAAQQANLQSATQLGAAAMGQAGSNYRAGLQHQLAQQGMQFDAANQLYGMGNDRWNMGQDAVNNMGQVGSQIDDINQRLIDQQYQMFQQQQNAPFQNYQNMLGALGSLSGAGTQTYNPGKMDYLQMGAGLGGAALMSDISLKDDLKPVAKINGFQLYKWKWNEKAREIGCDHEPTFGVVAQEVRELRPEAILEGSDGYLMVDYKKLPEIARTVAMGGQ